MIPKSAIAALEDFNNGIAAELQGWGITGLKLETIATIRQALADLRAGGNDTGDDLTIAYMVGRSDGKDARKVLIEALGEARELISWFWRRTDDGAIRADRCFEDFRGRHKQFSGWLTKYGEAIKAIPQHPAQESE